MERAVDQAGVGATEASSASSHCTALRRDCSAARVVATGRSHTGPADPCFRPVAFDPAAGGDRLDSTLPVPELTARPKSDGIDMKISMAGQPPDGHPVMKNAVSDDASDVRNRTHSVILEELASHWIALDGRARIIIDPSLTIFWINQPAVRLLARDPALGIAGDRIAEGPGRSAIKDLQGRVDAGVAYAIVQFVNGDGNYLLNAYRLIRGNTHVCIEIQVDCAEFISRRRSRAPARASRAMPTSDECSG